MTFRNPLRQGSAVLFCTALAACFSGTVGCDVYEDELLRRRDDDEPTVDAGRAADSGKIGTPADASQRNDTGALDATTPDSPSMRDGGTLADTNASEGTAIDSGAPGVDASVPPPDVASSDVSTDGTLRDANAINDTFDATYDAAVDAPPLPRDVDAAPPTNDASDGAPRDGSPSTDSYTSDGNGSGPDVQLDAVTPPPTFRIVRLGDGAMPLSSASTPVFIEERRWDGSIVGNTIALPTAKSGAQLPLTMAGNATSEGALSLSLDGRYLTLAGYATAPGRAAVATSSDVDRIAATVDAASNVDTTTSLGNAFLGTNVRSAASVDGTSFWVGGQSGGVWYFPRGGGAGAQIVVDPDNVRLVALFADRLYGSSGSSPMASVFTVGDGRPTTGIQNVTALTGMPQSGLSPYAFVLFDGSTTIGGLDTLYLTDDRSPESDGSGGGIQKWTFEGGRWSQVATFASVGGGMAAFRGLTGTMTSSGAILVASTAEASGNRLVLFVDDGAPNVSGTVIATAPPNTIFRGVALSPHP
jgi:hypothetical protein